MSLLFMQKMRIIETYAFKVYDTVRTVLIFVIWDSEVGLVRWDSEANAETSSNIAYVLPHK